MRYLLHLAYKGTAYSGWQRQADAPSVQAELEDCLCRMLRSKIVCLGCGRTDAGVHASQYFAHFRFSGPIDYDPVFRLSKMLPEDIVVFEFFPVSPFLHAQYHVQYRTYHYFIHTRPHPFLSELSSLYPLTDPDWESMTAASALIAGHQDFRYFCRSPKNYKHTFCEIREAMLIRNETGDRYRFSITGNRFLRGMVRQLVMALLEIGNRQLSLEAFQSALDGRAPLPYPKLAYPQGLHLAAVNYPYLERTPVTPATPGDLR